MPRTPAEERQEVAEVLDALASDARTRIAHVRDGLRSILQMLSATPGTVVVVDVPSSANGRLKAQPPCATMPARGQGRGGQSGADRKPIGQKAMAKASRPVKATKAKVVAKGPMKKRSRASA